MSQAQTFSVDALLADLQLKQQMQQKHNEIKINMNNQKYEHIYKGIVTKLQNKIESLHGDNLVDYLNKILSDYEMTPFQRTEITKWIIIIKSFQDSNKAMEFLFKTFDGKSESSLFIIAKSSQTLSELCVIDGRYQLALKLLKNAYKLCCSNEIKMQDSFTNNKYKTLKKKSN
eukprot:314057_1